MRYEAVNAMSLNEFLKEHRKERIGSEDCAAAEANRLTYCRPAESERELELIKPAPQTVVNNQ